MFFLKRRLFLITVLTGTLISFLSKTKVQGQESDLDNTELISIEWRIPREQVPVVRKELESFNLEIEGDASTVDDTKGLPIIYIIIGIVTVGELAETLLKIYRDVRYGGLIVSLDEDGEVKIENDLRLPNETLIVTSKDEIEVFRDKNKPQIIELIKALQNLKK